MHPLYATWRNMMARCYRRDHDAYPKYGGLGVRVVPCWHTFAGFKAACQPGAQPGPKPSAAHTLDRCPDPNGDYTPENARWATPQEQAANRTDLPKGYRRASYQARVLAQTGDLAPQSGFPKGQPRPRFASDEERRAHKREYRRRWYAARQAKANAKKGDLTM